MNSTNRLIASGLTALALLGPVAFPALAQPRRAPAAAQASEEDALVLALLAEDLEAQRRFNPISASQRGDRRFDDRWPDLSPAGRERELADSRDRLTRLEAIDFARLSPDNRINAALLQYELYLRTEGARFKPWVYAVTPLSGPQQSLPQLAQNLTFTSDKQVEDWVIRLERVPEYLGQITANLREGLSEGRTPPRVVMARIPDQALAQGGEAFVRDPTRHAMYAPLAGRDDALAERARRAISERVAPAFAEFGAFLRDEYVPGCRESLAATELPDGPSYYAFMIRVMTTLDLSAEQIHRIGLTEVGRIRQEMFRVIARSDFPRKDELSGDELFRAFAEYLRTDSRFYFTEPEELLNAYRAISKRIDADMPRLFGWLPRLAYGVREMPPYIAPSSPTAYYYPGSMKNGVAGLFVANTYRLDQRPKYEMIPLTLHEAVPGHHHQIALAQELEEAGLPEWRTEAGYNAFIEGWALYAERLGFQMGDNPAPDINPAMDGARGLYADPYDDFGRLSYEMWRAMRLVVDTGVHALGWTREQAIRYMLDNSALTPENIEREVDRYIAWPAQALGYKLGEMRIRALRAEAEDALGARFDIRAFHDAVLSQGAIPLDLLATRIREWAESQRTASE